MNGERTIINGHAVKGDPVNLRLMAMDHPSDTGECNLYLFERDDGCQLGIVNFHTGEMGPILGKDMNGVTMESVIMMLIYRLKGLQSGPGQNKQWDMARKRLQEALEALHVKTKEELDPKEIPASV